MEKKVENTALSKIMEYLPQKIKNTLEKLNDDTLQKISEIRLRSNNVSTATLYGENLYICDTGISKQKIRCIKVTKEDIDNFIYKLCDGSVYSYENSIKQGYITRFGARTGLCGTAVIKGNEICGFSEITGVNIRVPCHISGCSEYLLNKLPFSFFSSGKGLLVASAPGVGKTTLLRDLAITLSTGVHKDSINSSKVYRVSVIDERNEIYIPSHFLNCCADVYSGINKENGFELAIRCMSPEIIICDEIGSAKDADAINCAHTGGISVIASIHSTSLDDIFSKPSIKKLCDNGVFSYIYIMQRRNSKVSGELYATEKSEVIKC